MKPLAVFQVRPSLPGALKPLMHIARNLRWSWDHGAIALFRRLDHKLWEASGSNPVLMLGSVDQGTLEAAARDESFLAHQKGVADTLDAYLATQATWFSREHSTSQPLQVAYFSAEFGITECLSIFAGGLGILAGDHLKAATDLGVPLVGVGLLYQQGYFRQYLNHGGWQQEAYEDNDFHTLPVSLVDGVKIQVDLPGAIVKAQVWCAQVGRLKLFLLDTNIPENSPEHRKITDQLYGGDLEMRMKQEILLGMGGYRALTTMGLKPTVYHMNEGHSAFLGLEHILHLMKTQGLSFAEARVMASASLIFTTHTPVAAGHDYFPGPLVEHYFAKQMREMGIARDEFLGLGRQDATNQSEDFCMTVLALRLASFSNAVSALHGRVSRRMWNRIWPGVPEDEVPIGHVTNGVHFRSWVSFEMNQLYDRYLGPKWREEPADPVLWKNAESIPALELWRTHERRRERLVVYAREQLRKQLVNRGATQSAINTADEVLSPDALTIGFARRFASYKRATLLISNPERLARILNDPSRPVQIIYAGKAHPHDDLGKKLIQEIVDLAARPEFRRKLVFLENYDMSVARYMLQGADIWLNTPLRPLEASGTSGMKAQANGVINVSTLDGWWDEAWQIGKDSGTEVGWAIGNGETYHDVNYQNRVESEALYEALEREIVPTFYERRADGIPMKWVGLMKNSIARLCPEFNMHRQVMQYTNRYYVIANERLQSLKARDGAAGRDFAAWQSRIEKYWPTLSVESVVDGRQEMSLGDQVEVSARIAMQTLTPDDVLVELITGRVNADGEITDPSVEPMQFVNKDGTGRFVFHGALNPRSRSGLHGYAIRVLPNHPNMVTHFVPGLITWATCVPAGTPVPALAYS